MVHTNPGTVAKAGSRLGDLEARWTPANCRFRKLFAERGDDFSSEVKGELTNRCINGELLSAFQNGGCNSMSWLGLFAYIRQPSVVA